MMALSSGCHCAGYGQASCNLLPGSRAPLSFRPVPCHCPGSASKTYPYTHPLGDSGVTRAWTARFVWVQMIHVAEIHMHRQGFQFSFQEHSFPSHDMVHVFFLPVCLSLSLVVTLSLRCLKDMPFLCPQIFPLSPLCSWWLYPYFAAQTPHKKEAKKQYGAQGLRFILRTLGLIYSSSPLPTTLVGEFYKLTFVRFWSFCLQTEEIFAATSKSFCKLKLRESYMESVSIINDSLYDSHCLLS